MLTTGPGRMKKLELAVVLGVALAGCGGGPKETPPVTSTDSPRATVEAWREKHEADYRREYSTIAGLHSLKAGRNTAGSAPASDVVLPASVPASIGAFVLNGREVTFEPASSAGVTLGEKPLTGPMALRDDGNPQPDELAFGAVRFVVHLSGETPMLRVWDPDGPLARGFLGFSWFPIQDDYRVVGRFIKDAAPRAMKVANTFGDVDEYQTEGVVEFTLHGHTLRLRPFTTRPKRFYFVFRDASSGKETYEAARFLYSDLKEDGTTVLDFNMAYNPPCSFNPYTTCPIPLAENRLSVKILAGEKAYPVHVELPVREDTSGASARSSERGGGAPRNQ